MRPLILLFTLAIAGCATGSRCASEGGACRLGGAICYGSVPADDDCNADENPGGAFCCVGTACEAGKSPLPDGGCGDDDGAGCVIKGGTCQSVDAGCAAGLGSMDCAIGSAPAGTVECCRAVN